MILSLRDVEAAQSQIAGAVERTPCHRSRTLSALTGAEVYLKFENLQFTASFKERGALNRLLALSPEERRRGVIAMSAGNHAQGVAYHAQRLGIPATIVMPEGTPFVKVKHTMDFGARVLVEGASLTEANARAVQLAQEHAYVFVHPYNDPLVMAGQGTIALEMLAEFPEIDTLVVPIGGGGLIAGCAVAAKGLKPDVDIIGVEAELYPAMYDAIRGTTHPIGGQTIAEGIAVRQVGQLCVPIVRELVRDIVLAPETTIEHAIAMLLTIEKTVVEGAGAAGFAALLHRPELFRGRKVGLILCGGNIDPRLLSTVILRELSREGRILTLSVEIEDRPGILAKIATLVGEAGGNIIEVSHNRMLAHVPAKVAELKLSVEARDKAHAQEIMKAIRSAGYPVTALSADDL